MMIKSSGEQIISLLMHLASDNLEKGDEKN